MLALAILTGTVFAVALFTGVSVEAGAPAGSAAAELSVVFSCVTGAGAGVAAATFGAGVLAMMAGLEVEEFSEDM
jgi:hypothetical protein